MDQGRTMEEDMARAKVARLAPHEDRIVIGPRIRELRRARNLTLNALSENAGLSVSFLSMIERGISTPSIKALHDIANALSINISWFFPDNDPPDSAEAAIVVRRDKRRALRFDSGIRDELLCPGLAGQLELLSSTFAPGSASGDADYDHAGEEAGVIIRGQLDLWIDGDLYRLHAGDSFHFKSTRPHRYSNPGPTETEVIWAITPPSY
jgi:transcriptional regulator with XRE-family HTH domain